MSVLFHEERLVHFVTTVRDCSLLYLLYTDVLLYNLTEIFSQRGWDAAVLYCTHGFILRGFCAALALNYQVIIW